jgi:hypothetical protein
LLLRLLSKRGGLGRDGAAPQQSDKHKPESEVRSHYDNPDS